MENISGFSMKEQQLKMVPTPSIRNPKENLTSGCFLEGESSKKCNAMASHQNSMNVFPRPPIEKNKKKMITTSSLDPIQTSCVPMPCPLASYRLSLPLEQAIVYELEYGRRKLDPNMEPKKLRRTISNRISAHKSRLRKAKYIVDMEKAVEKLEGRISDQKQQIENIKGERELLLEHNNSLQNLLETLSLKAKCDEVEIEKKKAEIRELQGFEKMVNTSLDALGTASNYPNLSLQKLQQASNSDVTVVKSESQIFPNFDSKHHRVYEKPNEVFITNEDNQEEATEIDHYLNFDEVNA